MNPAPTTPYAALGGEAAVRRLVDRFYDLMDELPEAYAVRKLHPDSLDGARQSLFEFLSGWLGGPPLYAQKHGHPRLCTRLALADALQTGRPHGQRHAGNSLSDTSPKWRMAKVNPNL